MDRQKGVAEIPQTSNEHDQTLTNERDQTLASHDILDDFPEAFRCFVCLDLLYKPVVLSCGHVSCFWCVHKAMRFELESHCPICRSPYIHFPSICRLLHFLLLNIVPAAYKRRENQVLEEEKKNNCFSPQFDDQLATKESTLSIVSEKLDSHTFHNNSTILPEKSCVSDVEMNRAVSAKENDFPECGLETGVCKKASISDVLCSACKQLLYRPTVLNCGHVYCESCMVTPGNEVLICQVCKSPHPGGCPKVCLELDHFLEAEFPKEYALKREAVLSGQIHSYHEDPTVCEKKDTEPLIWSFIKSYSQKNNHQPPVHIGVGCDSCGMCPIIGKRYRCKDCFEEIGFDLCEVCYNTCSKHPGRFNQQHRPEHTFILTQPVNGLVFNLVAEQSEDGIADPAPSQDSLEDLENTDSDQ